MDEHKNYIYKTVSNIIADSSTLTKSELDLKYKEFSSKFPKVYENSILSATEDCASTSGVNGVNGGVSGGVSGSASGSEKFLKELSEMLNIRESVLNGTKSEIEANVQVSERVAKQYLYPKVGEPTQKQKDIALRKILKKHDNDMKDYDPNKKYE
jgi:hypothetical protein